MVSRVKAKSELIRRLDLPGNLARSVVDTLLLFEQGVAPTADTYTFRDGRVHFGPLQLKAAALLDAGLIEASGIRRAAIEWSVRSGAAARAIEARYTKGRLELALRAVHNELRSGQIAAQDSVMARYIMWLYYRLIRAGYQVDAKLLYLAHNQGLYSRALRTYARTGRVTLTGQSPAVRRFYAQS